MIDLDELIAEADKAYEDIFNVAKRERDLIRRLADALESVRAERDAALASIAEAAKLHRPTTMIEGWGKSLTMPDDFLICEHCTDPDNWWVAYPCETRKTLGLHEGENDD